MLRHVRFSYTAWQFHLRLRIVLSIFHHGYQMIEPENNIRTNFRLIVGIQEENLTIVAFVYTPIEGFVRRENNRRLRIDLFQDYRRLWKTLDAISINTRLSSYLDWVQYVSTSSRRTTYLSALFYSHL